MLDDDAFKAMNARLVAEKKDLELRLSDNKALPNSKVMEEKMKFSLAFIENMGSCVATAPIELKLHILGSIFSGKFVFENSKPRTAELSPLVSLIVGKPSDCKAPKTKTPSEKSESVSWGAPITFSRTALQRTWNVSGSCGNGYQTLPTPQPGGRR